MYMDMMPSQGNISGNAVRFDNTVIAIAKDLLLLVPSFNCYFKDNVMRTEPLLLSFLLS